MAHEAVLILPPEMAPEPKGLAVTTPYGEAVGGRASEDVRFLIRTDETDPRSLIYAAKEMGAQRVLAAEVVQPVSPLLEAGDLLVPADLIDLTKLRPFTFFVGKGYGFIKLNPPFCPDLMATLLAVAREANPRSFRGGVYVGAEGPRDATAAELRMYRQWGGDVVGSRLLPETYLARELELHYAALAVVGEGDLLPLLVAAARRPHGQTACRCAETMRFMKEQGVVGEDWKEWLG